MPNLDGSVFRTAIVKLTAACNLNCDYCYMFNLEDRTHTRVPRCMPDAVADTLLDRVEAYTAEHGLGSFRLVLHGGEPTLWPEASFDRFLRRVEAVRRRGLDLGLSMQTNGVRVTDSLADRCVEHGVSLGVSVDGPPEVHDRHRVTHSGQKSYTRVMRTVDRLLARHPEGLVGGFLSVIDPGIDPASYLAWVRALPITKVDVLWPIEYNHDNPPWIGVGIEAYAARPRYGVWLAELFERWWALDDPSVVIRQFLQTIGMLFGSLSHGDSMGNTTINMFVVNTDGRVEYPDYLRGASDEGSRSPFNLTHDPIQRLHDDPMFRHCFHLGDALPPECRGCEHARLCGGGFLAGRVLQGQARPRARSVLCYDHACFLDAVRRRVRPHREAWLRSLQPGPSTNCTMGSGARLTVNGGRPTPAGSLAEPSRIEAVSGV